jgi:cyclopropane fatty-acyl-phospholipid synthase-like methyltransferase
MREVIVTTISKEQLQYWYDFVMSVDCGFALRDKQIKIARDLFDAIEDCDMVNHISNEEYNPKTDGYNRDLLDVNYG